MPVAKGYPKTDSSSVRLQNKTSADKNDPQCKNQRYPV